MILRIFTLSLLFVAVAYAAKTPLNKYIQHFEGLNYDRAELHQSHLRAKRSADSTILSKKTVELKFTAHGRDFHLRLRRDTQTFAKDLIVDLPFQEVNNFDTSFIYRGNVNDDPARLVHGAILDGLFEGKIYSEDNEYYVEPASRYFKEPTDFHSVIYKDSDVEHPYLTEMKNSCGLQDRTLKWMQKIQQSAQKDEYEEESNTVWEDEIHDGNDNKYADPSVRKRRATAEKNSCSLYIQADHLYTDAFNGNEQSVLAQIANYVSAVNTIYNRVDFDGTMGIGFQVQRVRLNDTEDAKDTSNPFRFSNIGVEKFLELNSEMDHSQYCLAYVFTDRDFDDGVLGLAWVATATGANGGICEKHTLYAGGTKKSLNTGIITIQNYGSRVPTKVSHITFAHELGHNFGSPHDFPLNCRPGDTTSPADKAEGNFIMYARATSGDKPNNNKFSECSVGNMSAVLDKKKDICFTDSNFAFCGNGIVDEGEECDCGFEDQCDDNCCTAQTNDGDSDACKLKGGATCSPSEGPCCTPQCEFFTAVANETCSLASECSEASYCDGSGVTCPPAETKDNRTACNADRQVCWGGECSGSICDVEGLMMEECFCESGEKTDAEELCHLCCQEIGKPDTCQSSSEIDGLKQYYPEGSNVITMQPGAPCDNFKGYCDVFDKCRQVDADGPLARLKNAIFNPEVYQNIADWVTKYWWAVVLMGVGLIILMGLFIKICSVHTPSSNPKLPPARNISRTLSRKPRQPRGRGMEMK
ncbi:disintegrin and metalloproteinase domain-containing protein 10-like [Glandiceps talaboti]